MLCVGLMREGLVDACMSDDMDLFVYGCSKVLRYLSILNSTVIEYDLDTILSDLDISFDGFKQICVISGTDYNKSDTSKDIIDEIYLSYKSYVKDNTDSDKDFYTWVTNTNLIDKTYNQLVATEDLFDLDNYDEEIKNISIFNSIVNSNTLQNILLQHGFIFM